MNKLINNAYLIQRAKFEDREDKKGIDSIIRLDYMGSAEFEFGAAQKSLKSIRDNVNDYCYLHIDIIFKRISIFSKIEDITDIQDYLEYLSENKKHLKEYSDFNTYIKPDPSYDLRKNYTDFWWDLNNNIMFWKEDLVFGEKFRQIIKG